MKIYLAGYIQREVLDLCIAWRRQIIDHYNDWKGHEKYPIVWLNPLNGKIIACMKEEKIKSSIDSNAITDRDYQSVISSNLIIANMDTFGQNRPLIGTMCELAWAYDRHTPVIMITKEKQYLEHPFLKRFVSQVVPDVETLLEEKIVNYFYKGLVDSYD